MNKPKDFSMGNVADLQERRVARVQQLARLAAESGAGSAQAFSNLRHSVAGELLNQGSVDVTQQAMAGLTGEAGERALLAAIHEVNRTFEMEDRVLAAVVVPVAIRYTARRADAVKVWHGNVDSMSTLSLLMRKATGASKVAFDARFYRAGQLLGVRARDLRDHLLAIESGEVQQKGLTKPAVLTAGPEANWEVVYFLGVAVFDRGQEAVLLKPQVEEKLREYGSHAEWAMDQADPVAWSEGVAANAKCLGFYSLHRGLEVGETRLRVLQLDSLVSNMEQGVMGMMFRYAIDSENDRIRLLISSNIESAEFVWKRYGEEGVAAFRIGLDEVISARVADLTAIEELPMTAYNVAAQKKGIVW